MQASILFSSDKFSITPTKQKTYGKRRLILTFECRSPRINKNIPVSVDCRTKTAEIVDEDKTVLTLAGRDSFAEVDFINADGECIGSGSYKELPNMSAPSSVGLIRTYSIYKSNAESRVAHFDQLHKTSTSKIVNLKIDKPELDCLTKTLLIGKLVMMALLDPGFLHLQSNNPNEPQCITKIAANHILPDFVLPDWDYPAQLRMRIVGTIMGENDKKDYYVLFDPLGKPWYIMETNNSTELKILDPATYQPLLIGDNAVNCEEICTLSSFDKRVVGKVERRMLYVYFDDGFRKVYHMSFKNERKKVVFNASGDSRYGKNAAICKFFVNLMDEKEISVSFILPSHRLGIAMLLPAFCILASQHYQGMNVQAPLYQAIQDLCLDMETSKCD